MIYSDLDIRSSQGDTLIIEPFDERRVTAVGYDLSIGNFVYLVGHGLLAPVEGHYRVPSMGVVQILTKESLWLSHKIAGTIHSRVLLVSRGFSHISTTVDPSWAGPLLVTTTNLSRTDQLLADSDHFATIMFHVLRTKTRNRDRSFSFVRRILTEQALEAQSHAYVQRVARIVENHDISAQFEARLSEANRPMIARLQRHLLGISWIRILEGLKVALLWSAFLAVFGLHLYWDMVSPQGIPYDTKVFAAQLAAVIALLAYMKSRTKS